MTSRRHATTALLGALATLLAACEGRVEDRPNVLLISLDSTRRDLLACYGHDPVHAPGRSTSPNLDRLAREGVLMRDAYASSSWTLVSHLALMTGKPALVHGVDDVYQSYAGQERMLSEALYGAGYRTAGFYSGPLLEPHYGFGRGFERYEGCYGEQLAEISAATEELRQARELAEGAAEFEAAAAAFKEARMALMTLSHADVSSAVVTDHVLDELTAAAEDDRPFFVFAHYFDPHYDYVPPAPFDVFDEAYDGEIDGVDFLHSEKIAGPKASVAPREQLCSDRDLEHVRALYEGELLWTDAQVGRILARLEELGVLDDTLVLVTADHGDEFFEHGSIGHRRTLYEEVVRIPMILRHPELLPAGDEVEGVVALSDVAPTLLDLVGLEPEEGMVGRSFLPLVRGEPDEEPGARTAHLRVVQTHQVSIRASELGRIPGTQHFVTDAFLRGPVKILRTRTWSKPTRDSGIPEQTIEANVRLFRDREVLEWIDLDEHPDEALDAFSDDFSDPRARAALNAFVGEYMALTPRRTEGAVSKGRQRFTAMLKGLGYVEDDELEADVSASLDYVLPPPGQAGLGESR